ncbi:MAG TPA: hypothetical protein VFS23_17300 [Vicinamibacterales bacterium]|nr:hypothetical protein [Vicinamibacterales bacterium]
MVTRHNRYELRWLAEGFDGCNVHRIERANRLDRKRAPDAREDVVGDRDDVTPALESP